MGVFMCVFMRGCTHRPEEGLLDLLGEDVEHVHGLGGQGQVGARDPLVLRQLGLPGLLLLLGADDTPSSASDHHLLTL